MKYYVAQLLTQVLGLSTAFELTTSTQNLKEHGQPLVNTSETKISIGYSL